MWCRAEAISIYLLGLGIGGLLGTSIMRYDQTRARLQTLRAFQSTMAELARKSREDAPE